MRKGVTATFNRKSRRIRPDAPFDLDAEVAQAYEDFPELKRGTYFIDAATGRLVHPNVTPSMEKRILKYWNTERVIRDVKKAKCSCFYDKASYRLPANIVCLYLEDDSKALNTFPHAYTVPQKKRGVFDHELGHALTMRNATMTGALGNEGTSWETAAESFRLLRQFTRYGNTRRVKAEEDVIRNADYTIYSEKDMGGYFSAPAMAEILRLGKIGNLAALSPRETLTLSRKVSMQYTFSTTAVRVLREELRPAARPGDGYYEEMAERILKTPLAEAFKWGCKVLRFSIDECNVEALPGAVSFKETRWPQVRRDLKKRERQLFGPAVSSKRRA